ncbi:fam-c protein [Plasmodium vinckei petteri]|uniref:Fam-c protein n=1 Tax=Plasmodium vinckei petteri TaxID=138298 RepID=A0A6V7T020_PLAVN|nr:fam-c protein [Plasmodium vinckei petteri]
MNRRIFSLVCILFYVFMVVSIHCSEQKDDRSKESGLRSRITRAFKKTKRSNKKNDIESKCETQLNNNNNNDNDSDMFDRKAYSKYINSEKYKKLKYRHKFCCGLCHVYKDPYYNLPLTIFMF